MSKNKKFTVKYKRKREGKTNYPKRLKYLSAKKPRLVIRPHLNNIIIQLIEYNHNGDRVTQSVSSTELKKFQWPFHRGNIPSAYLTGFLAGNILKQKDFVIDYGLNRPIKKSRFFAVLKGLKESGINIKVSEELLPPEETISGNKIIEYYNKIKDISSNQFSKHKNQNIEINTFDKIFSETKEKIMKLGAK